MRKYRILLLLVMTLLLSACASAARSEFGMAEPSFAPAESGAIAFDESFADAPARFEGDVFQSEAQSSERLVIRDASLTMIVEEPSQSVQTISRMAEQMGGFVVSSNVYQTTYDNALVANQANITIRVPAEKLNEALEIIKGEAVEVQSENISGQDVTQEYTDLESRLRNLEAAEEELREIMSSLGRAEDVLSVYQNLRQVREEIEVIKGRMQYFEESARLSAINVSLLPDVATRPLQIGRWQPEGTAKAALETLLRALQFFANAAIWIVIFVLPVALVLAIPVLLIRRAIRRRRGKKAETPPAE